MKEVCSACLSEGRRLQHLGELRAVYDSLIPYDPDELRIPQVLVCWECRSLLMRCAQFQRNVASARGVLIQYTLHSQFNNNDDFKAVSLSNLISVTKEDIDFSYVDERDATNLVTRIKTEKTTHEPIEIDVNPMIKPERQDEVEIEIEPLSVLSPDPLPDAKEVYKLEELELKQVSECSPLINAHNKIVKIKALSQPSTGKILKQIKISEELAKKIQRIASQNNQLQVKLGKSFISNVQMAKPVKKKNGKVPSNVMNPKNEVLQNHELLKKWDAKNYISDQKSLVPTREQMVQRFTSMLRNILRADDLPLIKVRVLTEVELSDRRARLRSEPQYSAAQYKCESCIIGYYSQQLLDDHSKSKHQKRPLDLMCDICLCYIPEGMLAFHYGRHRVVYECVVCDEQMLEPRVVKGHVARHLPRVKTRSFPCDVCEETFQTRHRRRVHVERAHDAGKQFTCELCNKTFTSRYNCIQHVRRHYAAPSLVECEVCHKQYKGQSSLNLHMRNIHSRKPGVQYRCEECNMNFLSSRNLSMHLKCSRRHVEPSHYKHICESCGLGFMTESTLRDHVNYVHKGRSEYVCQHCDKILSSAGGLHKHVRFVHEGAKRAKDKECTDCGKRFTSSMTLRQHQNVHSGTRPFKCTECGDTFKQSGSLFTHRRLKHLGYKSRNKKIVKVQPQNV